MRSRLAVLGSLLAAPLAVLAAVPASARTIRVSDRASGRTLVLRRGDNLVIRLTANETTPYSWAFQRRPARSVMRVRSIRYVTDRAPAGVTGVGGHKVFRLTAVGRGRTRLLLAESYLGRGRQVSRRFRVTVRVR